MCLEKYFPKILNAQSFKYFDNIFVSDCHQDERNPSRAVFSRQQVDAIRWNTTGKHAQVQP